MDVVMKLMKKYEYKALSVPLSVLLLSACGGGGGGGGGGDDSFVNTGGNAENPSMIKDNKNYTFDGDEASNYYYFAASKGDIITINATPSGSKYKDKIVSCQNYNGGSPYNGIIVRGANTGVRGFTCGTTYSFTAPDDDRYILSVGYSVYGEPTQGVFTFNKQDLTNNDPMFDNRKYEKTSSNILSGFFVIEGFEEHYIDIDNGSIVIDGVDTLEQSKLVKYGDVVQIKVESSSSLDDSVYSYVNYIDKSETYSVKTRDCDCLDFYNGSFLSENAGSYYLLDKNKISFRWDSIFMRGTETSLEVVDLDTGNRVYYYNGTNGAASLRNDYVKLDDEVTNAKVILTINPGEQIDISYLD